MTGRKRRPQGTGSIYVTASGQWIAERWVTDPETGDRVRRRGKGRSSRQAWANLDESVARLFRGETPSKRVTLSALLDEWNDNDTGNGDESRRRIVSNMRNHVLPHFGADTRLSKVTARAVQDWHAVMKAEKSASVTRNATNALSAVMSYAVRRQYIRENPVQYIRKGGYKPASTPIDREKIDDRVATYFGLLRWLREAHDPAFYWVLFMGLGLRRGEVCGMKWRNVEGLDITARPTLVIRSVYRPRPHRIDDGTKNDVVRRIPLTPLYVYALLEWREYWQEPSDEWAKDQIFVKFTAKDGVVGFKGARLGRDWRALLRLYLEERRGRAITDAEFDAEYFRPHAVRGITASLLRASGVSLEDAKVHLGHLTDEMTSHYTSPMYEPGLRVTGVIDAGVAGAGITVDAVDPSMRYMDSTGLPTDIREDLPPLGHVRPGRHGEHHQESPLPDDDPWMKALTTNPDADTPPGPTKNAPESP